MKFCGIVGFVNSIETSPGVWEDEVFERTYFGDVQRNTKRWEDNSERLNSNLKLNNTISIVADDYMNNHLYNIRYISWQGVLWEVDTIEIVRPRLTLSIGGVYNGPTAATTGGTGGDFRF